MKQCKYCGKELTKNQRWRGNEYCSRSCARKKEWKDGDRVRHCPGCRCKEPISIKYERKVTEDPQIQDSPQALPYA